MRTIPLKGVPSPFKTVIKIETEPLYELIVTVGIAVITGVPLDSVTSFSFPQEIEL